MLKRKFWMVRKSLKKVNNEVLDDSMFRAQFILFEMPQAILNSKILNKIDF